MAAIAVSVFFCRSLIAGNLINLVVARQALSAQGVDKEALQRAKWIADVSEQIWPKARGRNVQFGLWRAYLLHGDTLWANDYRHQAVASWLEAADAVPRDAALGYAVYDRLGKAYTELGMPESALEAYERSIALNSQGWEALLALGRVAFDEHGIAGADTYFSHAVSSALSNPDAGWYLAHQICVDQIGLFYRSRGAPEAAARWYIRAIEIHPQSYWARAYLGMAYLEASRISDAEHILQEAIRIDSSPHAAHVFLGFTYAAQHNYASAIDSFERGLLAASELHDTYVYLCDAYLKHNDCAGAQSTLRRLMALDASSDQVDILKARMVEGGCSW